MFAKDIGIDLGTANVLIHVKGKGIVLDEPAVVAIDKHTNKVLAVGTEASKMVGRTPGNIVAIRPMKDGVIADFDVTEMMLRHFINKLNVKGFLSKPRILVCCPTNITNVEQKAIQDAAEKSGGKKVYLEEEPKVAAIGAGMDIFQPSGNMVIDIGGGTTDVAVLSMGDIVTSESIKSAGDMFDNDIIQSIKKKHKLLIGERTAETIKIEIATVFPGSRKEQMDIRGRDMVTGLPRTITIGLRRSPGSTSRINRHDRPIREKRIGENAARAFCGHYRQRSLPHWRRRFIARDRPAACRGIESSGIHFGQPT